MRSVGPDRNGPEPAVSETPAPYPVRRHWGPLLQTLVVALLCLSMSLRAASGSGFGFYGVVAIVAGVLLLASLVVLRSHWSDPPGESAFVYDHSPRYFERRRQQRSNV